jgi:uncharacterized protein with NRDE domain
LCTVTYLPLPNHSFILTQNRDEHYARSVAKPIKKYTTNGHVVTYPCDENFGGTWFASSKFFTLCLLNGAYENHSVKPTYRHSRGLIILDFFSFNSIQAFTKKYNFSALAPFTLILIDHATNQVFEIIWDEKKLFITEKNATEKHIWSSSTLYSETDKQRRIDLFTTWQTQNINFTQNEIIQFHEMQHDRANDAEGIFINRNNVLKTVSLVSLHKQNDEPNLMIYKDFIQHQTTQIDD